MSDNGDVRPPPITRRSQTYQPDNESPHPPSAQRRRSQTCAADGAPSPFSRHRSQTFRPEREPFSAHPDLQLNQDRVSGPFSFLNPTRGYFEPQNLEKHVEKHTEKGAGSPEEGSEKSDHSLPKKDEQLASAVSYKWTSRNNRKGRHAITIKSTLDPETAKYLVPPASSNWKQVLRGIVRMFTYFPYWDVSWLVAVVFTLGSVVWVFNAFFVFLPLIKPSSEFPTEMLYGGGITAFVGATIFEIGSFLLMAEAVNENRTGCFGWAVEQIYENHLREKGASLRLRPSTSKCTHHHKTHSNLVSRTLASTTSSAPNNSLKAVTSTDGSKSWVWFPSWTELKSHYFHELGFLACLSQLIGATIFWISGFTALPGILNKMSPGLEDGIFWTPQILGGSGFIISGTLFMIETQRKWYIPAFSVLGWHIGFWNLIGGVGFTLCPAFGYDTSSWAQYQASCSTFWASWAFLIGSSIQWYESLAKYPVETDKRAVKETKQANGEKT